MLLSPTGIDRLGTANLNTILQNASVGGDTFATTGFEFLVIQNNSGAAITLTIAANVTPDGLAVSSRTVSVPANDVLVLGGWPPSTYADSSGNVDLTYSAVASVKVAVIQFTGL